MPPRLADLVNAVVASLGATVPALRPPAAVTKAYEMYCYSIVFDLLREIGYTPQARQLQGRVFEFPRAPKHILNTSYSYFRFTRSQSPSDDLELQANTYVVGTSGRSHEVDVGIFDRLKADRCRGQAVPMPKAGLWVALECKCYDSLLSAGIGRDFLGLAKELGGGGQYFAMLTTYPWRRATFDIVRSHGRKYLKLHPGRPTDVSESRIGLKLDFTHIFGS